MLVVIATILLLFSLNGVLTIPTPEDSTIEAPIHPREFAFAAGNKPDAVNVEGLASNNEECGRLQDTCAKRCAAIRTSDACISEASKRAADCRFAVAKNETYSFSFVYHSDGTGNDDNDNDNDRDVDESPDADEDLLFGNFSSINRATTKTSTPVCPKDHICHFDIVVREDKKKALEKCYEFGNKTVAKCNKWKRAKDKSFGVPLAEVCIEPARSVQRDCEWHFESPRVRGRESYFWRFDFNPRNAESCKEPPTKDSLCEVRILSREAPSGHKNKFSKDQCKNLAEKWSEDCGKKYGTGDRNVKYGNCRPYKHNLEKDCMKDLHAKKKFHIWSMFFTPANM
ncbi:hypothetical protein HDU96_009791 [Phlyctochytrium bullatum]|nr:hypothetical protein HDU96_009791 [Phlyctochytrium bullatum]